MTRWQYTVVNLGMFFAGDRLVSTLARLGADGWELVTIYDKSSNWLAGMEKGFALFKRPVPDGQAADGPWARSLSSSGGTPGSAVPADEIKRLLKRADIDVPDAAASLAGTVPVLEGLARCEVAGDVGIVVVGAGLVAYWTPDLGSARVDPLGGFDAFSLDDGVITLIGGSDGKIVVRPRPQAVDAFVTLMRNGGVAERLPGND